MPSTRTTEVSRAAVAARMEGTSHGRDRARPGPEDDHDPAVIVNVTEVIVTFPSIHIGDVHTAARGAEKLLRELLGRTREVPEATEEPAPELPHDGVKPNGATRARPARARRTRAAA